jgi:glycosyltransferase involved in cell wall biosynthesis
LSSLRIVYVTDSYPPVINGVSYVVQNLAEVMVKYGHQVEVITIDSTFRLPKEETRNGVLIRRFTGIRPAESYHIPSLRIIREIKRSADVIHSHNFHGLMPLVSAVSLDDDQGRLAVVTPHYHTMGHHFHSKIAWIPYKKFLQSAIRRFDIVHTVSEIESRAVQRDFGLYSIVVENGVPPDVYKWRWCDPSEEGRRKFNILFVGRIERYKRVDLLIRAASLVKQRVSKDMEVEVTIIGSGSQVSSVLQLANELQVKVKIEREVSRRKLLDLYSTTNCFVNCSEYEAFSIVSAEALAIGTPVVVVYPWGSNFREYPRAAIVHPDATSIAEAILQWKRRGMEEHRNVPTWDECGKKMLELVYTRDPADC